MTSNWTNFRTAKHHFLQRLYNIPQLRSLHVSNIQGHVSSDFALKDIAYQIVDIVTLRPEIQLCYVGVRHKCYEIMETRTSPVPDSSNLGPNGLVHGNGEPVIIATDEDDHFSETEGDEETEDDVDDDNNDNNANMNVDDDEFTEVSDDGDSEVDISSEADEGEYFKSRFRLREILFYDDKISIFKARHGRL